MADKKGPDISIIITNYNYGAFLGDAIGSALGQSHARMEVIVVDDGSTDGSRDIMAGFAGIKAIHQDNQGQTGAAMAGLAAARGAVIVFLDADDGLMPEACSRIADAYAPDIALYQFALECRGRESGGSGVLPARPFLTDGHRQHVLRHGDFPSAPNSGNAFSAAHCRNMLALVTPEDRRRYFDGFLLFSAPFSGRVVALEGVLGFYRQHGGNVSRPGWSRAALRHNVENALWQRRGIALAQGQETGPDGGFRYLSPYHLRNAMALRRMGERDVLLGKSRIALFAALMRKAGGYHGLSPLRRLRLWGAGLVLLAAPRGLLALVWPEFGR